MFTSHSTKSTGKIPRNASKFSFLSVSEFSAILGTAFPLAIGYVGERLIGVTDSIMLGRLGPEALSASGLALSVYNLFVLAGAGMLFSIMILASHARGSNRFRTVPLLIRQGLWVCGILTVMSAIPLWYVTPILTLTGQDPGIARMAGDYMHVYLWSLFPVFSTFLFSQAFAAMDRARTVAVIVWLEVALNAILDYVLISGKFGFPALGMEGAGLATVIAYGVGHLAFFVLLTFHRFFRNTAKYRHAWRPRWHVLNRFFHLGAPRSLETLLRNGLYSVFSLLAGWIGIQALVIYTIVSETALVIKFLTGSAANAGAMRAGRAYAGKDPEAIRHALGSAMLVLLLFLAPMVIVFLVFPEWVVMAFLGIGSPETKALVPLATPILAWGAFFMLAEGVRLILTQVLSSFADVMVPALIGIAVSWGLAFPLGALLAFAAGFGVLGLWVGLTVGMVVICIAYAARFRRQVRALSA
uniref:Multidrug-efflux transporter n=1 Tax=Candidatus Kentrum sp. TUN TaxID=2126343 RepID=A0A450ZN15_9GAMM|nr:MAG: multidrug resistance protein, MATE family [Candidatus Kentron sp. TUN]VFK61241.1 MAG: multidrug resistance protein, MATE family [Candidatus Kentron sp. TUN]